MSSRFKSLLPALFLICVSSQAQIINTIAGNGVAGFSGDGGPAVVAEIGLPTKICTDRFNNIYIADRFNNRIRKVDPAGMITTVAGCDSIYHCGDGGPATLAGVMSPSGVTVDENGNIFILEFDVHHGSWVRKVNNAGVITTIAGNGFDYLSGDGIPATSAALYFPHDIVSDASGNVYIAEIGRIRKVDSFGIITTIAGNGTGFHTGDGGPATAAGIINPICLCIDLSGNIYVCESGINTWDNWVRKIGVDGIINTVAGNGTTVYSGDGGPATAAGLSDFGGIAIDTFENIYIADRENARIRKVDILGIINTFAGNGLTGFSGDGSNALLARFNEPCGLMADIQGNVYVTDMMNNRVRKINTRLNINTSIAQNITLYPNPASDYLFLGEAESIKKINVMNYLGEVVISKRNNDKTAVVYVKDLSPGDYILKANDSIVIKFGKRD